MNGVDSEMRLTIGEPDAELTYEIEKAEISAISVQLIDRDIRVYHEALEVPEVSSWMELTGKILQWEDPNDPNSPLSSGALYFYWHRAFISSTLQILEREGNYFRIQWHGLFEDVDPMKFSLDCRATFTELEIYRPIEERRGFQELLSLFLDAKDFSLRPSLMPPQNWVAFEPRG